MSLSIQTNIASLVAQNNIRINSNFQSQTIQRLSSGYKINSAADDAAGLAVANKYRGDIAELAAGVQSANNGVGALQVIDGGINNISTVLDRLRTLATQSASATFSGDRTTLNNEYQSLLGEVNRQAANIGLDTGGKYNTKLTIYTGGGSAQANAQITVDLSGANNAVDTAGLGISTSSVAGGGTGLTGNNVRLDDAAASFLTGTTQSFTFHVGTATGNQDVTFAIGTGGAALNGSQVIGSLNNTLQAYGITASIGSAGTLQFGGAAAFSVTTTAAGTGPVSGAGTETAVNTANYNLASGAFTDFAVGDTSATAETVVFQNAGGTHTLTLNDTNADSIGAALTALNATLNGTGISAIKAANGTDISFQSTSAFSVNETNYTAAAGTGTGNLFGSVGAKAVTAASANASNTGSALAALSALTTAVGSIGLVQGNVGAGENKLQYAINLAQSQITNYSAAQSGIRDADVASEAANLTKAQVLQQASLAALAQANSAPQAVLSLLKG